MQSSTDNETPGGCTKHIHYNLDYPFCSVLPAKADLDSYNIEQCLADVLAVSRSQSRDWPVLRLPFFYLPSHYRLTVPLTVHHKDVDSFLLSTYLVLVLTAWRVTLSSSCCSGFRSRSQP